MIIFQAPMVATDGEQEVVNYLMEIIVWVLQSKQAIRDRVEVEKPMKGAEVYMVEVTPPEPQMIQV